ncbi:MAG: hypothetical protein P4L51_20305 [Puia sp.]|nr:hypothetical protein [Puia sp.]
MKKTAAILLCTILLFNWAGYRLLLSCWQNRAGRQLEARLDVQQYDESQLVSIKVPAPHLSSYSLSGQFQRTSGQVSINGVWYRYVKKRLYNDSLEYICIPDQASTLLQSAANDLFRQSNDWQAGSAQKKPGSFSGTSNDFSIGYYITHDSFHLYGPGAPSSLPSGSHFVLLPAGFFRAAEQPPDILPDHIFLI